MCNAKEFSGKARSDVLTINTKDLIETAIIIFLAKSVYITNWRAFVATEICLVQYGAARYLENAVLLPIVTPAVGRYIGLWLNEEIFNEATERARCSVICPSLISHVPYVIPRSDSKGRDVTSFASRYTWITYEARSLSTYTSYIAYVGRPNYQRLWQFALIPSTYLFWRQSW